MARKHSSDVQNTVLYITELRSPADFYTCMLHCLIGSSVIVVLHGSALPLRHCDHSHQYTACKHDESVSETLTVHCWRLLITVSCSLQAYSSLLRITAYRISWVSRLTVCRNNVLLYPSSSINAPSVVRRTQERDLAENGSRQSDEQCPGRHARPNIAPSPRRSLTVVVVVATAPWGVPAVRHESDWCAGGGGEPGAGGGGEPAPDLLGRWGQSATRCSSDLQWWQRFGCRACGHLAAMWLANSPQL